MAKYKGNARGPYEIGYNKDAKALPAKGCCDPLKDGSVSQCQYEHNVLGIPFCAVDGIINNPKFKDVPLPVAPSDAPKAKAAAKPAEKAKDKYKDVLTLA